MEDKRVLVAGDAAAMLLFAIVGIASHEKEVSLAIFARSFLPFVVAWFTLGALLGALRMERPSWGLLGVYLLCGVAALVTRSVIFHRTLFNLPRPQPEGDCVLPSRPLDIAPPEVLAKITRRQVEPVVLA